MKHHDQKTSWGKKGFIWLTLLYCCSARKSGRNSKPDWSLEAGADAERPWKGAAYWLASLGLLSLFSYWTQDQQPRDATTHKGLGLLHWSLIEKMHYSWGISSTEAPSFLMTLTCIRLTEPASTVYIGEQSLFNKWCSEAMFIHPHYKAKASSLPHLAQNSVPNGLKILM